MTNDTEKERDTDPEPPEDRHEQAGAEGRSKSPSSDKLPGVPADDNSPLGDTDQHSNA